MNLSTGYLVLVAVALGALSIALVLPFLQYFLLAILLAVILFPLHQQLEPRVGAMLSSFLLLIASTLLLIVPFVVIFATVAGDTLRLARRIQEGEVDLATIEDRLESYVGFDIDLAATIGESLQDAVGIFVGRAPELVGAFSHALIGIGLSIFLLFFLLKDGESLLQWIRSITPLPDHVQDELYQDVADVTSAVILGHVLVAIIQGSVAGIGLFVVGIPNAIFWTFIMIILAILPVIGAFLVWGPAAVYLVSIGEVIPGVLLFIYGAAVVSITDEFIRPLVVNRKARINPGTIIVGVIGGLYFIGFMGLFFGPVILGALKVTLEVINEYYHELNRDKPTADPRTRHGS